MVTNHLENLDEADADEVTRYTNAFIATANALGDAKAILIRMEASTFDLDEQRGIVLKRRRIEDDEAANARSFDVFFAGGTAMRPPSQEQVDGIVAIAVELARMTQQKNQLKAVVDLATSAATQFNAIRASTD